MSASARDRPLILFVPGLRPKPEPATHRKLLFRCLLEGLRRRDDEVAAEIGAADHAFDIVSWTFDFYGEHRDAKLDAAMIDGLLEQRRADERDIVEATSVRRRFLRWTYRLGDRFPFLIPHLASDSMELHLSDLRRYISDKNGIASRIRDMLRLPLIAAHEAGRPVLLIGHSMGSVIAWDTLWLLTHAKPHPLAISLFMTMGSPLGQRYLQRRILGHDRTGSGRYPGNIRRWLNVTAVGDLTAAEPYLARHYAGMQALNLVAAIEDVEVFNYARSDGELNAHAEYGYLVNEVTAERVADWWRTERTGAALRTLPDSA